MRLEKIRLAGFKSFVDPTTVAFPGNLVGIVGPNGCGKSNVIDAVRWVMGERSARLLRGESMADVIFNGSTGRQPVGVASIELVFDNSDGRAGGEYARFSQISVKRQVGRDGQSVYALNGARCRRRDIQDLFLGTGLGPRSYAIIEQGMISRVIEARPEELRLFLEEAAGISRYKERRRETEQRMQQTRENLARLDDLRAEVGKQLEHLERQAATAEQYTRLRDEERQLDRDLKALRWRLLDGELRQLERQVAAAQLDSERLTAEQRRIETAIETRRDEHADAMDDFNAVQGRFYAVGAEIARAEQAIQFASEARGRREGELVRLDQELTEARHHLERDRARLDALDQALRANRPRLAAAEQTLELASDAARQAETERAASGAAWEALGQALAGPTGQAQAERARLTALEQREQRERERLRRLDAERAALDETASDPRLEQLAEREPSLEEAIADSGARRDELDRSLAAGETALGAQAAELDRVRTALQQARGRQTALTALREAALADSDGEQARWRADAGLAAAPRLADGLRVEPGWETAVESVLGARLGMILTADLAAALERAGPPVAGVGLFEAESGTPAPVSPDDSLAARIQSPWPLAPLLAGARAAEELAAALAACATLEPGGSLVTRAGVRVGRGWLEVPGAAPTAGLLAQSETLRALETELDMLEERETALRERETQLQDERTATRAARAAEDRTLGALQRELGGVRAELGGLRTRAAHRAERRRALDAERAELTEETAGALRELEETRTRLHALLADIEGLAARREALAGDRARGDAALAQARERERAARDEAQQLRIRVEADRAAHEAARVSLDRASAQQSQLQERRDALLDELEASREPLAEQRARLDEQLGIRVEVEDELGEARRRLETLDAGIRALEQERQTLEQRLRVYQEALDRRRLERQDRLVRRQTLEEQLAALELTPEQALAALDPAAEEGAWQERLTRVAARIQRLGAINLAAIDEFREQSQRKVYLDAQHADISSSLETLEQAIRRIDRETRGRFKETFERVDQGFRALFPRLFGGGQAALELTDADLLETGIAVMARPPGKRNSTIHLLSGGEKALTAVALVFAIFELNPAPFCMLDEVDAPLDDANVGRFCELVRSMSDRVQFIFISHNKVTMELAEQLLGVTMQEPGVSRLVTVDVDEAVRLAGVGGY